MVAIGIIIWISVNATLEINIFKIHGTLSNNLNNENLESYITYGLGYIKFKTIQNNIMQELYIFIPNLLVFKIPRYPFLATL